MKEEEVSFHHEIFNSLVFIATFVPFIFVFTNAKPALLHVKIRIEHWKSNLTIPKSNLACRFQIGNAASTKEREEAASPHRQR